MDVSSLRKERQNTLIDSTVVEMPDYSSSGWLRIFLSWTRRISKIILARTSALKRKTHNQTSLQQHGRQAPHTTTARIAAAEVYWYWTCRHNETWVDFKHRTRLVCELSRTSTTFALHEHWHGPAYRESENALYGEDDTACWPAASDGGITRYAMISKQWILEESTSSTDMLNSEQQGNAAGVMRAAR